MLNRINKETVLIKVLTEKVYTKEVLEVLEKVPFRGVDQFKEEHIETLKESLELINKVKLHDTLITIDKIHLEDIQSLTNRQQYCFKAVINHLELNEFSQAYHELHDFVEDYTNGRREDDYINANEYIAYEFLISYFLKKVKNFHIENALNKNTKQIDDKLYTFNAEKRDTLFNALIFARDLNGREYKGDFDSNILDDLIEDFYN
ncbi:hypothetical protein [Clostridium butyricum]|uniref:hypothetical protein n=1 Tax=Clostridium butyricum TaxID=1492 RepID=UPI0022E064D5|nr:hypothetical protein [Clostridium butyricum]